MNEHQDTTEPVDAVITWVDGADPKLRAKQAQYFDIGSDDPAKSAERFLEYGELYYCLVSILMNAPFVNRIHIVTDAQYPPCLEQIEARFGMAARQRISVVDHSVIFRGYESYLPTFNSRSIESMLHRIPGLSSRYIYLNDDCFLGRPVQEVDFFVGNKPVLRGKWMPSMSVTYKDILRRNKFAKWLGIAESSVSFKEAQYRAFEYLGYGKRFFWHDHIPSPMIRPTLQRFFDENPERHRLNIAFRIRDNRQVNVVSLLRALEILKGAPTTADTSLTYLKAYHLPAEKQVGYLKRKIAEYESKQHRFICLQNLAGMDPAARDLAVRWLDQLFGNKA